MSKCTDLLPCNWLIRCAPVPNKVGCECVTTSKSQIISRIKIEFVDLETLTKTQVLTSEGALMVLHHV